MRARGLAAALLLATVGCSNPCPPSRTTTAVAGPVTPAAPRPTPPSTVAPAHSNRIGQTYPPYEKAIHVVFDHEPIELIRRVRNLSGSGLNCRHTVASIVGGGPHETVVEFMNTQVSGATLEPSFGCRALTDPNSPRVYLRYWVLRLPPATGAQQVLTLAETLHQSAGIQQATPVPTARPPADPFVGSDATNSKTFDTPAGTQWYLHQCQVPETDKVAPVVAIIDFGFRTTHEELKSLNMTQAFNTCDLSQRVDWPGHVYHGTGTAGLLAAVVNGVGMQGVAPGAEVWPIQGTCPTIPIGIPWATAVERVRAAEASGRRKIVVLEVETGYEENFEADPAANIAIQTAVADGVIVVLPAGNRGIDASMTVSKADIPASGAIVVGATAYGNPDEALTWSNFGDRVVVWAPGDPSYDLTISDESDTAYTPALGYTSGAAPKVAGVVAMMLTLNETLTPAEVVEALSAGPAMTGQSGKQLDAKAALESARTK